MAVAPQESGPWTVARLLQWTGDYLQRQGVASPRLCSEILLAHVMGCDRLHLFTQYQSVPTDDVRNRYRAAIQEAAAGRPIAYLTGFKEFFSLRFEVSTAVLIPRPDTETLVERVIALCRAEAPAARVLDVGVGSGCIAISLAKHLPAARVAASDLSEDALAIARANADHHGVADRIDFRAGDLLAPWTDLTFDVIVSNPPYISAAAYADLAPSIRDHEPAAALRGGADGLDVIRCLVAAAPAQLAPGGHLLLEVGHDQAAAVAALLADAGFHAAQCYRDLAGHERVVHARRAVGQSCVA